MGPREDNQIDHSIHYTEDDLNDHYGRDETPEPYKPDWDMIEEPASNKTDD